MKKWIYSFLLLLFLVSCAAPTAAPTTAPSPTQQPSATSPATVSPSSTAAVPSETPRPTGTATPAVTITPDYPLLGYGPTRFPPNIDPLTGLTVVDMAVLDRRPIIVKVENLPRDDRPQAGLSLADIIYEYYTEQGGTRFSAVFYGKDAETVAPVRSARFFDFNVVRMYKASFIFGYAYADLYSALASSEFSDRLIVEGTRWKEIFTRFDPKGRNILQVNTGAVAGSMLRNKVDNSRQNLDGMLFQKQAPLGGETGQQLFVRFSGGIYNRWDYDSATGKYLRFSDAADDVNRNNEQYTQLTDRLTQKPIAAENVVILQVSHRYIKQPPNEVVDMTLIGEGNAWLARDGKVYPVKWKRAKAADVLTLVDADGKPFAFKPGQTWYEVQGSSSSVVGKDGVWKFVHSMP